MEFYNISVEIDDEIVTLSDKFCSELEEKQILIIQNNCIFSEIVKKLASRSGLSIKDVCVVMEYNSEKGEHDDLYIDEESNLIIGSSITCVITLNNEGSIGIYGEKNKKCVLRRSFYMGKIRSRGEGGRGRSAEGRPAYHRAWAGG